MGLFFFAECQNKTVSEATGIFFVLKNLPQNHRQLFHFKKIAAKTPAFFSF